MSNESDEWASKFVTRIAEKRQAETDANALLMRKQGMIRSEAPYLWDHLRTAINQRVRSVNTLAKGEYFRATPEVQGYTEHTLESPAGHLSLIFQAEVPVIKFRYTKLVKSALEEPEPLTGEIRFQVFDGGLWFVGRDGTPMGVAQTAENFLNMHS
jgi:hypothetical protein